MDAVLTSLAPAAPAAPVRGIGSAVRSGGVAESEAAAGFAGILAAVPSAPAVVAAAPGRQLAGPEAKAADAMPEPAATGMPTAAPDAVMPADLAAPATDAAAANPAAPGVAASTVATAVPTDAATTQPAVTDIPNMPAAASTENAPAAAQAAAAPAATLPGAALPEAALVPEAPTGLPTDAASPDIMPAPADPSPLSAGTPATTSAPAPLPMPAPAAPAVTGPAAPVVTSAVTTSPVAADPEIPASAAAPLSVAAALDAASPAVAAVAAEVELDAAVVTDKPAAAPEGADDAAAADAPEAAAAPTDAEPAPQGPTAAEQALLGVGLHTYLKTAGLSPARAATVDAPQSATNGGGTTAAAAGRPAAFAALVNDFLAADSAATTGNSLGVRLAGDLSDPATVAQLRAQGNGASAASIRSQVAEQVARGLQAGKGEEKLTIRLNPEELGQVDVDLRAVNDRLTVTLRAGTPEAEQALRSGARELTDSIIERSGRFQHVEVRVESRDGGTLRTDKPEDRQQDQKQDGKQQDGRRDGRGEARGHQSDDADSAREAWVRAFTDLSQPSQEA